MRKVLNHKRELMKVKRAHLLSYGVQVLQNKQRLVQEVKRCDKNNKKVCTDKFAALNWANILEEATQIVNSLNPFFKTVNVNLKVNSYRSLVYIEKSKQDKSLEYFSKAGRESRKQMRFKNFLVISNAFMLYQSVKTDNNLIVSKGFKKKPIDWVSIWFDSLLLVEEQYPYLKKVEDNLPHYSFKSRLYSYIRKCNNLNKETIILKDNINSKKGMYKEHLLLIQKGVQIYTQRLNRETSLRDKGFYWIKFNWSDILFCSIRCVKEENPSLMNVKFILSPSSFEKKVLFLFEKRNNNTNNS